MHLILGHPEDFCCAAVAAALERRGCSVCREAAPLSAFSHLNLRFEPDGTAKVTLALEDGPALAIESVFVRATGSLNPTGWDGVDHAYMQAELQAVTLAWLSVLDCPVVNRLNAESWYRPRRPLLFWLPRLRDCGLEIPESLITDSVTAVDRFRQTLEASDLPGAIFRSLARNESWLVGSNEWDGVSALQPYGPVCLAEPYRATTLLCIVGGEVMWDTEPSPAALDLSERLLRFADGAGLLFVEIALAEVRSGLAVVHVDPLPTLEHFGHRTQSRMVAALTDVLTGRMPADLAEAVS